MPRSLYKLFSLSLSCLSSPLYAQSLAVVDNTLTLGARYSETEFGESSSILAHGTTSLSKYLGLTADASRHNNSDHSNSFLMGLSLFVRDYDVGKIGASFSHAETGGEGQPDVGSNHVSIATRYYLKTIDLSAARTRSNYHSELATPKNSADYSFVSLAWYAHSNLRMHISQTFIDIDTTMISISYQPDFLNKSIFFELGRSHANDSSVTSSSFLTIAYVFGPEKSLINRIRQDL